MSHATPEKRETTTPETDAFERDHIEAIAEPLHQLQAYARYARRLESERNEAREALRAVKARILNDWDDSSLTKFLPLGANRTQREQCLDIIETALTPQGASNAHE